MLHVEAILHARIRNRTLQKGVMVYSCSSFHIRLAICAYAPVSMQYRFLKLYPVCSFPEKMAEEMLLLSACIAMWWLFRER